MAATPNRRAPVPTLWDAFSRVPDRRAASGRRHPSPALPTIALAALLSGRRGQAAITRWGRGLGIRGRRGHLARVLSASLARAGSGAYASLAGSRRASFALAPSRLARRTRSCASASSPCPRACRNWGTSAGTCR